MHRGSEDVAALQARRHAFERGLDDAGVRSAIGASTLDDDTAWLAVCPCCGYPTLSERRAFDICAICRWEDDGQDDNRADEVRGGPNGDYSLSEARRNFIDHRTSHRAGDNAGFQHAQRTFDERLGLIEAYDALLPAVGAAAFIDALPRILRAQRRWDEREIELDALE
jgi:hypothetical protein